MYRPLSVAVSRAPGLLTAAAGLTLIAAGLLPWAHHGPGIHIAIGLCVFGSDCSRGLPGPPQYLLVLLGVTLAGVGARVAAAPEASGRSPLALGCISMVLLTYDVWSIQGGFSLLGMEVRDVAFFLAPAGVGLLGVALLATAARRRSYPVLAVVLLVLVLGSVAESNLVRSRPIGHCPGRTIGTATVIC